MSDDQWKDAGVEAPARAGCYVVWMVAEESDGHLEEWRSEARWDGNRWVTRAEIAFWFDRTFDSLPAAKVARGGAIDQRPQVE